MTLEVESRPWSVMTASQLGVPVKISFSVPKSILPVLEFEGRRLNPRKNCAPALNRPFAMINV